MNVEGIHREVVGMHFQVVKDLLEGQLLAPFLQNHAVLLLLKGGLDEVQQVLLVHASSGVDVGVHL